MSKSSPKLLLVRLLAGTFAAGFMLVTALYPEALYFSTLPLPRWATAILGGLTPLGFYAFLEMALKGKLPSFRSKQ